LKILIVTHYYKPHIGGIEIVAYNQAKELVKQGHEVTIVTSKLHHEKAVEQNEGIIIVRVTAWNLFEKKFDVPYPIFSPRLISTIKSEIKKNDIIHAHGALYLGSFICSLFARIYKKPFLITEHVGFVTYKSSIINFVEKIAFSTIGKVTLDRCQKVFILNKNTKDFLESLTNKPIAYLPNGVDTNLFKPATAKEKILLRKKYNFPLNRKLVLFVGRFVQKKGVGLLIEAKTPEFDLVLVGEGKLPKNAENTKGIFVLNSLPQENLAEIYQACDVFVLPSTSEGFPLSLQEAMASGLPIVSVKESIITKSDKKEFASFIQLSSFDIKETVSKLLNDSALRKSKSSAARKVAIAEFSWINHATLFLGYTKE